MSPLKSRARASAIHLAVSLVVAAAAAVAVFGVWYPLPYSELSGGRRLFSMIMLVDVLLGPLITLVIFSTTKTRRHLAMDFTVIAFLQASALGYGMWTAFAARPVHLVFEYSHLTVVHAVDIAPEALVNAPPDFAKLPQCGPTLLSLRPLQGIETIESVLQAVGGISQAAQPALWQPYDAAREQILQKSTPVAQLKERYPSRSWEIDQAVARTGRPLTALLSLPLLARYTAWTALIDAESAQPVGFLALDSF